ncbi:hypothetical protein EC3006_5056 [Escherichia coli 3006]|nr:hypothetical protein EC3006_5056 [Escherichia coli 3006]
MLNKHPFWGVFLIFLGFKFLSIKFRQKNTAVFLIELNTLQVAECIILSPLLNQGKAARFWKKFLLARSRSFSDRCNGCDGASLIHCVSVAFFHSTS